MKVNLYTTTYNNGSILKEFIDFYKSRVPDISIYIYDMKSTDDTLEIAKKNNCIIKNFHDFFDSKDNWRNGCWKYLPCDCVVICNINELIDLSPNIFKNCSIVRTKGFDIININILNEEIRNDVYDKFCIFDPHVIKDMHYEGTGCNPQGFIRIGEFQPNLYHLTKLK